MSFTLARQYGAMISKIIASFHYDPSMTQDLYSEAYVCLYKKHKLYDPTKGAKNTFLWTVIHNHLITYLQKQQYKYLGAQSKTPPKYITNEFIELLPDHRRKHEESYLPIFLEKIQCKFSEADCEFIVDYFCDSMEISELRKKYGNYIRILRRLEDQLEDVFEDIREEN